ncbi:S8 family serine peptidase [Roseomonas rosulenta]|uniref:S8 family serine peptidase n=1 Tax=Roseomonas rosulenta TaxID=2748667 RepID=UPI0018DF207B|nr:S8 family serine peptidase [Roseomonas rosulenta]
MVVKEEKEGPQQPVRRCFVFRDTAQLRDADGELQKAYLDPDPLTLSRLLLRRLDLGSAELAPEALPLRVTHRPLNDWQLTLLEDREAEAELEAGRKPPQETALAIRFASTEVADAFRDRAATLLGGFDEPLGDLRLNAALHWGPGRGEGSSFGTLADAHRLIRADALGAAGLDGDGVKVVVIDQGVDRTRLPPGSRFGGGWWKPGQPGAVPPGQAAKDNRHGTMIARNVLALAPRATIFDCPLIPPRILGNLPAFLSDAFGAITRIATDIVLLGTIRPKQFRGRWVIVNAWSVYDPRGEATPGEYTRNRYHWVACAVDAAATVADVVFAAGNCGAFCPDGRCAEEVIGPGRSILGANSLDSVLTVGAARADGIWAGYSSQGPGQFPAYGDGPQLKPDLAAPSHFRVLDTAHRIAGGSSAASAVAAGAVAALRTRWSDATLPSDVLFKHLRATAWQPDGSPGWNNRFGHGVLDCAGVLQGLAGVPAS